MLCEQCGEREANVVIRENRNGSVTERHLCAQCAQSSELGSLFDEIPFVRILTGILGMAGTSRRKEEEEDFSAVTCPSCGTGYDSFVKNGRFGCPDCYSTFGILMDGGIKKIQGSDRHTGKRPKQAGGAPAPEEVRAAETPGQPEELSREETVRVLRERLAEAIAEEEYEEAARLRDEIRSLEKEAES